MKTTKKLSLVVMAVSMIPMVSCTDFTNDFNGREALYAEHFEDFFGKIDPDHDWSMAKTAKVNINVPGAAGYNVRLLTEAPTSREAIVLYQGKMKSDELAMNVDLIRGKKDVYVEIKNSLGIALVDGYYSVDGDGIANVSKMVTRAYNSNSAPGTSIYTTTLKRVHNYWDDTKAAPSVYKYDWGFVDYTNADLSTTTARIAIPESLGDSWVCNSNPEGQTKYSLASVSLSNSKFTVGGTDYPVANAVKYTKPMFEEDCWMLHGATSTKFHIQNQGKTSVHVATAYYSGSGWTDAEVITWVDGNWKTVASNKSWVTANVGDGNGVSFNDISMEFDNIYPSNTEFLCKLIASQWTDNLYCGGMVVSTEGGAPIQAITNGQIQYTDVRGGNIKVYGGHNELREEKTKRYLYGSESGQFNYRTYDVTKMVDAEGKSDVGGGYMSNFYIINGEDGEDVKVGTEDVKYKDMFPLYGLYRSTKTRDWTGSPFREGDNHIDPYFRDGSFNTPTEKEMSPDAQIITLGAINSGEVQYDGSVTVKLMGLGTNWANDIGYFYYPKSAESDVYRELDGEMVLDFNKVPKVIIRKNMQTALNGQIPSNSGELSDNMNRLWLSHFARFVDGCAALGMSADDYNSLMASGQFTRYTKNEFELRDFIDGVKASGNAQAVSEAKFAAPIYKLPFYGWVDGANPHLPTGSATFVWPKDYVIGFFGIRTGDENACELARVYTSSASVQRHYFNDLPRGSAFSYKGKNYIGLEDELDYDNNDFLFEVQGVQSITPDITPEDDVTDTKTTQNWIIACEDLGGSYDYDFNDLVWAVSKEVNTTTTVKAETGEVIESGTTDIYFTPLAAGGTYEAVIEYNTSIVLTPAEDDPNWITLGEIHQLVSRDSNAPTNIALNVDPDNPNIGADKIGERIKIGSTIPLVSDDISISSILSHFRVKIKSPDDENYTVTNLSCQGGPNRDETSKVPQFILLPGGWAWPAEHVGINKVYKDFDNWVQDADANAWYWNWRNTIGTGSGAFINNPY